MLVEPEADLAPSFHWGAFESGSSNFETQRGSAAAGQSFQYCDPIASSQTLSTPLWTIDYSPTLGERSSIDQIGSFPGNSSVQGSAESATGHSAARSALYAVEYFKLPLHAGLQQQPQALEQENHACQTSAVSKDYVVLNDMRGDYESTSATTVANKEDGLRCDEPGCLSSVVFKRKCDLRRHQRKHQRVEVYDCPVKSCRYQGFRAFYRADKFRSHLRSGHVDTTIATCPVGGCGMERPLRILTRHCAFHDDRATGDLRNAICQSAESQTCPLRECNATVRLYDFRKHLEKHDASHRLQASAAIESIGYDAYSLSRLCPFCKTGCSNKEEWISHVVRRHLIKDQTIRTQLDRLPTWVLADWLQKPCNSNSCLHYACQLEDQAAMDREYQEKLAALEPNEVIYPKRLEMLRMWSDFWSHPVFDGDRPTV